LIYRLVELGESLFQGCEWVRICGEEGVGCAFGYWRVRGSGDLGFLVAGDAGKVGGVVVWWGDTMRGDWWVVVGDIV